MPLLHLPEDIVLYVIELLKRDVYEYYHSVGYYREKKPPGLYLSPMLTPLLHICRDLRRVCLPLVFQEMSIICPSFPGVEKPITDISDTDRWLTREILAFQPHSVKHDVQNIRFQLSSREDSEGWISEMIKGLAAQFPSLRTILFKADGLLYYGMSVLKILYDLPQRVICTFPSITQSYFFGSPTPPPLDSIPLDRFYVQRATTDPATVAWANAGLGIQCLIIDSLTIDWIKETFRGLNKIEIMQTNPCSREEWQRFLSRHPLLDCIELNQFRGSLDAFTKAFPLLSPMPTDSVAIRAQPMLFTRSSEGSFIAEQAKLWFRTPFTTAELANTMAAFGAAHPNIKKLYIDHDDPYGSKNRVIQDIDISSNKFAEVAFSSYKKLTELMICGFRPVDLGPDSSPFGVLSGATTPYSQVECLNLLSHFTYILASACPSLKYVHHYMLTAWEFDDIPYPQGNNEAQWICEVTRDENGIVGSLRASVDEYSEEDESPSVEDSIEVWLNYRRQVHRVAYNYKPTKPETANDLA